MTYSYFLVRKRRKHPGFIMGAITYKVSRREFENKEYPFEMTAGMQAIRIVAPRPSYK